ncbi:MAG: threonine/serine exporter family protein [Bacteroidales bacterium]|nr:threonine/serine exporter family protein [Bacteroidales bacterium]
MPEMKIYDFDKVIDRRGSGAVKTDALKNVYGSEDLVPLWVADMDFETPDFIVDALRKRLEHPVFGYTVLPEDYWATVKKWILEHHGWHAIFPLIPGAGVYYTMSHAVRGEMDLFVSKGMHTAAEAGIMAIAILLVSTTMRMITVYRRRKALK